MPASTPQTVGDITAALDAAYPPVLAEPWDAVGLVCGDPGEPVHRILVCVDVVEATLAEATELDAQLIVAHHPLLLRGVHGVAADTSKGRLVHRMIRSGIALFCAHTNADSANPGVSDALADTLGLTVLGPLAPHSEQGDTGIGRIGELSEPEPLAVFVRRVADALPRTQPGVHGAGDRDRPIRTVAVSGGAGDSYLAAATAAGVDAYVTADLRHHPASEHLEPAALLGATVPALVGVTHWASEWPWCEQAAGIIRAARPGTVEVHVSHRCTDPWTVSADGAESEGSNPVRKQTQ
ncbi:MAG: Nif3-like dinuclear metal center hexameric protein [Pseudonocardiaceae bacterium]